MLRKYLVIMKRLYLEIKFREESAEYKFVDKILRISYKNDTFKSCFNQLTDILYLRKRLKQRS